MNKGFVILSDGNVLVTNENGYISRRNYDNNFQQSLLSENKIEIIDNKLKKLKKDLINQESILLLSKNMLKFQPLLILLCILSGAGYGMLFSTGDFLVNLIYHIVESLILSIIPVGLATTIWGVTMLVYNKKIKKQNTKITMVEKIKEDYEKELSDVLEKQMTIEALSITTNEPVSLIEQTNIMETQINEELDRTYSESLNQQSKKRVLSRKKEKKY